MALAVVGRLPAVTADGGGSGSILIRPGAPPPAAEQRRMAQWHRGAFDPRMAPVFAAWRRAEDDLVHWRRRGSAPGCRALAGAVRDLEVEGLLPTPEWSVSRLLQEVLYRLAGGARACLDDRYFDARYELDEARRSLRTLDRLLDRWELSAMP